MIKNRAGAASFVLVALLLSFDFFQSSLAARIMGNSAVLLYAALALVFFLPLVIVMTEIGADLRREGRGIYAWASRYLGARLAFVGAFVWYLSCIILIGDGASLAVHYLSIFICGGDTSSLIRFDMWLKDGLTAVIGILMTIVAIKWHNRLRLITIVGGMALIGAMLVLLLASAPLFFWTDVPPVPPVPAQATLLPFGMASRFEGASQIQEYAQLVIRIVFAYCCISVAGGLANHVQNAGKTIKKKIALAAIAVIIGYSSSVLLWGAQPVADGSWRPSLFSLTENLGASWEKALILSPDSAVTLSSELLHISGLLFFLATMAALSILIHAPLRLLMGGVQESGGSNTTGVPEKAMWIQCLLILVVINVLPRLFYYQREVLTQIFMILPCLLLAVAFYLFKTTPHSEGGVVSPKNRLSAFLISGAVIAVIILSNVSAAMLPAVYLGEFERAEWALYGGSITVLAGLIAYEIYRRRMNKEKTPEA